MSVASSPAAPPIRVPWTRQRALLAGIGVGFVVALIWAWQHIGMTFGGLWSGFGDVRRLLARMLPPDFSDLSEAVRLGLETLWMAVIGTTIAVALSIPIAFGAARNTTPHPLVRIVCRGIIVLSRAVPDLIFAAIFVRALGIGVLPGVLALGLHSIGMVGKLFADAIEQTQPMPREAVTSVGARKWQAVISSIVPQVVPSFIATALYRLDINLRSSTVLGIVGAGGIGFLLQARLRTLTYDQAIGVVIIVFALITVVEAISALARGVILGGERTLVGRHGAPARRRRGALRAARGAPRRTARPAGDALAFDRITVRPPFRGDRRTIAAFAALAAVTIGYALFSLDIKFSRLPRSLSKMWEVTGQMFPLDFSTAGAGIKAGMIESIAIAVVATTLGALLALPLGLLAARNVAPRRFVYLISRLVLLVVRGVPELILAVILVAAMGLGPVPGTLALAIGSAGFFAKLIADSVEEVDPLPREAVFAAGARRTQEVSSSVLPQAMPSIVSNLLYVVDINLRTSTILGIVGGGGIGFLLFNALRVLHLRTVGAICLAIFVVVYAIELLAGWIRKQLL